MVVHERFEFVYSTKCEKSIYKICNSYVFFVIINIVIWLRKLKTNKGGGYEQKNICCSNCWNITNRQFI